MTGTARTSRAQTLTRIALGGAMVFAGTSHLTFARGGFRAQVPEWVPGDPDVTVLVSGVAEIAMGTALVALPGQRRRVGAVVAAFLAAVFPGNLSQYVNRRDALGLDSDVKRLVRLPFQPVMIAAVLWSTGLVGRR